MSRPAGDPAALAAGSRGMSAAAGSLRETGGRLRGATSFVVDAGAWRGRASEAFLVDAGGFQPGLARAADTLDQAAAALADLAARLDHAQSTWDRAQRLAAVAGVTLDRHGGAVAWPPRRGLVPDGGVRSPADAADPLASVVAGQAVRMAEAAEQEAAAARRLAASRLEEAGQALGRGAGHAPAGARGAGGGPGRGGPRHGEERHAGAEHGEEQHGNERHEGPVRWVVGRLLELGAEVATATHHVVSAAEARIEGAGRLAATADDPAVRAAAGRVVQTAGRPLVDGTVLGALPLAAPILELSAAMHHGEPLPRALAGALGSAVGADLGGRAGLAACGGEAAVTEGAGLIVCPTLTAVGGALGAQAGRAAALHVYDEIAGPPPDPAASSDTGTGATRSAEVRPEPGPGQGQRPRSGSGPGPRSGPGPGSRSGSGG